MPTEEPIFANGISPCFYFNQCRRRAELEKDGKAVCRPCAGSLHGREYPLRTGREALVYQNIWEAARDLDMLEPAGAKSRMLQ